MDAQHIYGSPGTLYSRCGGVFGVSAFVDRCMDMWMQDDVLNANRKVRTWHETAQRCGFKFLVVQIVCNLTGGPQRYTGRPMDIAHKWLGISMDEWEKFMELFNEVCGEFNLSPTDQDDLNALMISMMDDCITWDGDPVPPNPGPARPSGNSLYARVGGVYPVALFVDRLVDSVLADDRFPVPRDGQKRNEASLKYLVTELMCSEFGGPEVVTSRQSDEVKLLVPKNCWPGFVATAQQACDHFPPATRGAAVQIIERAKKYMVDDHSDARAPLVTTAAGTVKSVIDAAAGKMLSKEVIAARHAAPGAHVGARRRVFGDPRTIYGKTGGVFGLARLVDKLMDVWMENPALNANARVAKWHESQQKFGFKFLVAQLMGYLCGGPQRYTGRPMDESHQHLNITQREWQTFVQDADKVFTGFNLAQPVKVELLSIIARFQEQCVNRGREVRDPGHQPNAGSVGTLYHKLGGVYPIAQFADRVVELVLKGDRVHVDTTGEHRHPPGIKYMVTELFCNGMGGPEVATSKGYDDAKLGVPVEEWPMFLTLAAEAAEVFPTSHHRTAVVSHLNELKAEICVGIVSAEEAEGGGVGKLIMLGFPVVDATAALDKCDGNVDKAKELLVNGWNPREGRDDGSSFGDSMSRSRSPPMGRQASACPFAQSVATASVADVGRSRQMDAAQLLAEKGISKADIAKMLGMDESELSALPAVAHGRVLGSNEQEKLDELLDEDVDLCCPVMLVLYEDPVIASDGFIYERSAVETLIKANRPSPMTRENLGKQVFPAKQKKTDALQYRHQMVRDLCAFAEKCSDSSIAEAALERATEYLIYLKPKKYAEDAHRVVQLWQKHGKPVPSGLVEAAGPGGKGKGKGTR
jgi:hemoglobin